MIYHTVVKLKKQKYFRCVCFHSTHRKRGVLWLFQTDSYLGITLIDYATQQLHEGNLPKASYTHTILGNSL